MDCDFDVCPHNLPDPWVLNIQEDDTPTELYPRVSFLPTTSWQTYYPSEPVINIERFSTKCNNKSIPNCVLKE